MSHKMGIPFCFLCFYSYTLTARFYYFPCLKNISVQELVSPLLTEGKLIRSWPEQVLWGKMHC